MRTILISREKEKYIVDFLEGSESKWQVVSYVLLSNLNEIIYEWIELRRVPPFRYT